MPLSLPRRRACRGGLAGRRPNRTRWLSRRRRERVGKRGTEQPHGDDRTDSTEGLISALRPGRRHSTGSPLTSMSGSSRRVRWKIPSRVELIDGYMVDKMGKNAEHSYATKEALKALDAGCRPGGRRGRKQPVRIPEFDEPEPDIAIVRGSDADYRHRIPTAADVALLVEVSETTLSRTGARSGRPMPGPGSPSTGSSTWSPARSRSTPGRSRRAVTGRARTTSRASRSRS